MTIVLAMCFALAELVLLPLQQEELQLPIAKYQPEDRRGQLVELERWCWNASEMLIEVRRVDYSYTNVKARLSQQVEALSIMGQGPFVEMVVVSTRRGDKVDDGCRLALASPSMTSCCLLCCRARVLSYFHTTRLQPCCRLRRTAVAKCISGRELLHARLGYLLLSNPSPACHMLVSPVPLSRSDDNQYLRRASYLNHLLYLPILM
jgi:hypothetical protein